MLLAISLTVCALAAPQDPQTERLQIGDVTVNRTRIPQPDGEYVLHGKYTETHANGVGLVDGKYVQGIRSGTWRFRYPNGKTSSRGSYKEGVRKGKWRMYREDGSLRAEGKMLDDHPSGPWEFWLPAIGSQDPIPSREETGTYSYFRDHYPDGQLRCEGALLDQEPHGPWNFWWEDGSPQMEAEYARGEQTGDWHFFHRGGYADDDFLGQTLPDVNPCVGFFQAPALTEPEPEPEVAIEWPTTAAAIAPPATLDSTAGEDTTFVEVAILQALRHSSAKKRTEAIADLRSEPLRAYAVLLRQLRALDWQDPEGLTSAQGLVGNVMTPVLAGHSFEWKLETGEDAWAQNRLGLMRAGSFLDLSARAPLFWELDLAVLAVPGSTTLTRPTFLFADWRSVAADGTPSADTLADAKKALKAAGGSGTERALDRALEWLVRHQSSDGSWKPAAFEQEVDEKTCGCTDGHGDPVNTLGVTSLVLLALIESGSDLSTGPYREVVSRGTRFLLKSQEHEDGVLIARIPIGKTPTGGIKRRSSGSYLYDHHIATQVLCRLLTRTSTPALQRAAEGAVKFLLSGRAPFGAWGYRVPSDGRSDSSSTGWAMAALFAARRAGLEVPQEAIDYGIGLMDELTDLGTGRTGYVEPGTISARVKKINDHFPHTSEPLTALTMRCYQGLGRTPESHPILEDQADLLLRGLPEWDLDGYESDLYGWYHSTYAMRWIGGKHWERWNKAMKPVLLQSQRADGHYAGSWDPIGPWGYAGGRVYSSALMALCLGVYQAEPPWEER